MDQVSEPSSTRSRRWVTDGPPLWTVALTFIGVILVAMSDIGPAGGMLVVAVGLIITVALEFRAWSAGTPGDRETAAASFASLPARLQQAQARRIERNRWR
ncbi:MAG: hypothetical protein WAS21_25815 [Geminicoccaceae bacterium]